MNKYILNKKRQTLERGGDYEVHNADMCKHLPEAINWIELGYYTECKPAVIRAKLNYPSHAQDINGCRWCCTSCHTE